VLLFSVIIVMTTESSALVDSSQHAPLRATTHKFQLRVDAKMAFVVAINVNLRQHICRPIGLRCTDIEISEARIAKSVKSLFDIPTM